MFAFAILASSRVLRGPVESTFLPCVTPYAKIIKDRMPEMKRVIRKEIEQVLRTKLHRPIHSLNADQEEDPENFGAILGFLAEQAATTLAWEIGKWIGSKIHHQDAESNYYEPWYLRNAEEEFDPENFWGRVLAFAKETAIKLAKHAAVSAAKWGYHKIFGQEVESNLILPFRPVLRPGVRPVLRPGPIRPFYFSNAEEEEDSNPWFPIVKEILKEAAKSAAAEAVYQGAKSAGKWGFHKMFGQSESNSYIYRPRLYRKPVMKYY